MHISQCMRLAATQHGDTHTTCRSASISHHHSSQHHSCITRCISMHLAAGYGVCVWHSLQRCTAWCVACIYETCPCMFQIVSACICVRDTSTHENKRKDTHTHTLSFALSLYRKGGATLDLSCTVSLHFSCPCCLSTLSCPLCRAKGKARTHTQTAAGRRQVMSPLSRACVCVRERKNDGDRARQASESEREGGRKGESQRGEGGASGRTS